MASHRSVPAFIARLGPTSRPTWAAQQICLISRSGSLNAMYSSQRAMTTGTSSRQEERILARASSRPATASAGRLPLNYLAARIRNATTDAQQKETVVVEKEADAQTQEKLPAEPKPKIKLGEVRRLMQLAKPEKKTIAIAVGLVSRWLACSDTVTAY